MVDDQDSPARLDQPPGSRGSQQPAPRDDHVPLVPPGTLYRVDSAPAGRSHRARDAVLADGVDLQRATREEEPGCEAYCLSADPTIDTRLVVHELWRDEASLAAHFEHPYFHEMRVVFHRFPRAGGDVKKYRCDLSEPVHDDTGTVRADFFTAPQMDDRQAIVDLVGTYCRVVDSGDFGELRNVFTRDATAELGGFGQTGIEEICDRLSEALGRFVSWEHHVDNHEVSIEGDAATARCAVHAVHVRPAGEHPPTYDVRGTYEDKLVRTAGGWRITHRSLVVTSRT
jgi:quinol monooxygenase YgiN